jgi:hypothetical protein
VLVRRPGRGVTGFKIYKMQKQNTCAGGIRYTESILMLPPLASNLNTGVVVPMPRFEIRHEGQNIRNKAQEGKIFFS